jgi:hypothetical protein
MADVLRLLAKVRGFFSRLAARRLLAKRLPRGLREARLALRAAPAQPPPGEFWTAGAHPAPLLRLRALPPSQSAGVLDPRKFRLDPATQAPANEQILPLWRRDPSHRWLLPAFRRRFVDLPWMARDRALFLGPTAAEWFCMWWEQSLERGLGGRQPEQ